MPIRVPDELPAVNFLREENVFVMTTSRASGQEIRPLKVLILNLMPKKIETSPLCQTGTERRSFSLSES